MNVGIPYVHLPNVYLCYSSLEADLFYHWQPIHYHITYDFGSTLAYAHWSEVDCTSDPIWAYTSDPVGAYTIDPTLAYTSDPISAYTSDPIWPILSGLVLPQRPKDGTCLCSSTRHLLMSHIFGFTVT